MTDAPLDESTSTREPALSVGMRVGPYEVLGPLAAGGMGEVYRARDTRLLRDVAIKVLPSRFSYDPTRLLRFEKEARAAGMLNHPNVLTIFDVGTHERAPYVVSELLEGETLRKRLANGALPVRKVAQIGAQIAQGLAAAHEKGIVHRDLKPENLFLMPDGRVKILDFGLAKLVSPEESDAAPPGTDDAKLTMTLSSDPGFIVGTVSYMSPEQVRGDVIDHRTDLFALGAILFELLTGVRAFSGASPVETMSAILKDDPFSRTEVVRRLPRGIGRIVRRCLEKSTGERFQSARDVAFDLEAVADETSVGAPARGLGLTTGWSRGRRVATLGAAVLFVGAFVAATVIGVRALASRPNPPTYQRITFARGIVTTARFTPDRASIVYSAAWGGRPLDIYTARPPSPDTHALGLARAGLLAVHPTGDLGVSLLYRLSDRYLASGTFARVSFSGGSPRELVEGVLWADFSPDGSTQAVVRRDKGRTRLECPVGHPIYETGGLVSHPRFSPDGTKIAFLDHPVFNNDRGDVAIVDLGGNAEGKKTVLSGGWGMASGLAWSGAGREILFSAAREGIVCELLAVDLAGRVRRVTSSAGGLTLHDLSSDGRALVSRDNQRRSMHGRRAGDSREHELSYLDWSYVADISEDGDRIVFTEEGDGAGGGPIVCVRGFGDAAPVRLGNGYAQAISPDGRWVLAISIAHPEELVLYPVGAGSTRHLPRGPVANFLTAEFVRDGQRIVFNGVEKGHAVRAYVQDLAGGEPRAVTEEGVRKGLASPDGDSVLGIDGDGKAYLYSLSGRPRTLLSGLTARDAPAGFSRDGRALFLHRASQDPATVLRLELSGGAPRELFELAPVDPAGIVTTTPLLVGNDGATYVYSPVRVLSELYLVSGLPDVQ